MYRVERYNNVYFNDWNNFVARSKNATFLFNRNFMEYHADRFADFSLMIFKNNKLAALLPANITESKVHSHQGLTYGGLLFDNKIKQAAAIAVFKEVLAYLVRQSVTLLSIKTIPHIYHKIPSQELEYALFLCNAKLIRRDVLSVIDNTTAAKIATNRMEGVKKGITNGFKVEESNSYKQFWEEVLQPNLEKKHSAKPVHNLDEILLLKEMFPENIKLFVVKNGNAIAAGTVIFETDTVAHAQYISGDDNKGETGSLDFLYYELVTRYFAHKKYFDFGTSNEHQGTKLNEGLAFWKESYGARTVIQDFYEVDTANFKLLDNVLL